MRTHTKGFTLIELLVVIAIIGLLSTLAVVSLSSARAKARDATRITAVTQLKTALELYHSDNIQKYPNSTTDNTIGIPSTSDCLASAGFINAADATNCKDPKYMTQVPRDPQGSGTPNPDKDYQYFGLTGTGTACSNATSGSECIHYVILFKLEGSASGNFGKDWNCVSDNLPGGKNHGATRPTTVNLDTCKLSATP